MTDRDPSGNADARRASHAVADVLGLLGLAAMAALQAAKRLPDFDLPWHLALGRIMVATRSLPKIDPLAHGARPIRYMEVLSDLGLYGVMRAGGVLGLQLFGALMLVGAARIIELRCRRAGAVRWLVLGFALLALNNWMIVRPATLSFIALGLLLLALEKHRNDPQAGRPALWATVPLVLVWANVHGFVVLGVAVLLAYAAYRGVCRFVRGHLGVFCPRADGSRSLETFSVAVSALAASCVNVAGPALLLAPFRARADFQRIGEWQTTSLSFLLEKELGVLCFALLVLAALALGREQDGGRWPNAFDLGILLFALLLGRSAARMLPVAVVMTAPLVARRLATSIPVRGPMGPLFGAVTLCAAPLAFFNVPTSFGVGFEPRHFPEAAVSFVERARPVGRMWNFLDFGGYLAWRLHPQYQVLVDGRSGWVHDPELLRRFHASLRDQAAFDGLVRDLGLEWAIARAREGEWTGAPLASSPAWTMVYFDPLAAVYVKADGPNAPLARAGYRVLRHLTALPAVLQAAVDGSLPDVDLAHDGELALEQAPDSPRAVFLAACGAIARRDRARFGTVRAHLAELAPGHPTLSALDAAAFTTGTR